MNFRDTTENLIKRYKYTDFQQLIEFVVHWQNRYNR
jgi:hypothetical protein